MAASRCAPHRRVGDIADIFGLLKREGGPSLAIDEIDEIAAEVWAVRR